MNETRKESSFQQRFQRFGVRTIDIVIMAFFVFCAISFVACVVKYSISYPWMFQFWEIVYLLPVGCCLLGLLAVIRCTLSLSSWKFVLLWSLYFLIQSTMIILLWQSPPQGDGGGIYEKALYLFNGGQLVMDTNYFYWQMGTVYFDKLLMSVIGTSYTAFKCLGTLMLLGAGICLYNIANNHMDNETAKIAFAMYVLFAPITLNVSHFAHQHIAFFLLMLGLCIMQKPTWLRGIIGGGLLGLMNVFRPWGILAILSLVCFGIYKLLTLPKESKKWKLVVFAVIFLMAYFSVGKATNLLLVRAGYIDPADSNESTMIFIKIENGIDPDTIAFRQWVNAETEGLPGNELTEARNAYYKERVKELLTDKNAYIFAVTKMFRMLGSADYWFENCFESKMHIYDFPVRLVYFFNWFQYIFLLGISALGYWKYRKKKTFHLLTVFTIGYGLAHFFIGAYSAYRVCLYPLLLIYGAYFVKDLFEKRKLSANKAEKASA